MHHSFKHRFTKILKSRNWKKLGFHQAVEYSAIGSIYIALEGDPIFWPIGIATALSIHFIVFEAIDAMYSKKDLHPKIKWFFEHDHH